MIDLTGPLVRARLTMLLGGRPFRVERTKERGVVLIVDHEHGDLHAEMPLTPNLLELDRTEALRRDLEEVVHALDRVAFPHRQTRMLEATREYHRLVREHFDEFNRHMPAPRLHPRSRPAPTHRDAWKL